MHKSASVVRRGNCLHLVGYIMLQYMYFKKPFINEQSIHERAPVKT